MMNLTEEEIAARLAAAQTSVRTDASAYAQAGTDAAKCAAVLVPLLQQDGRAALQLPVVIPDVLPAFPAPGRSIRCCGTSCFWRPAVDPE